MKTTVDIPDELYSEARKLAAARGQQVTALIAEGLQKLIIAQLPKPGAKTRKNGKAHSPAIPRKAAQWLSELRTLGRQNPVKRTQPGSAAEILSRMRR